MTRRHRTSLTTAAALLLASGLAGCSACGNDHGAPEDAPLPPDDAGDPRTFDQCRGDGPSFVRQAFLALDGRRPRSQAEVDAYADLYRQATEQGLAAPEVVARAIMTRPEFTDRWIDVVMDALHVQRLDLQSEVGCWNSDLRGAAATTALATSVRDKPASMSADGMTFTMLDLARSSIALDDLTPIYRGQLFSLAAHPIPAANVAPIEAELAKREDFGVRFDASYLHRDTVCLACHTSESSVTNADDPAVDRHWPVPGNPEQAVYGAAAGIPAERAHAVFRVQGFLSSTGATRPWGWSQRCGSWNAPSGLLDDPARIDAKLASVTGMRPTVFDLDAALMRGFEALRTSGAPTATLTDPDAALAWLVTLKITEDVWRQATGTQLTIANYFPRNQAASDLLHALAKRFVASGYSLRALLVAIVSSDYFNRIPPDGGCGAQPYAYPNVFDPWVTSDSNPVRRRNGPGDAVTALDGRTLVTAAAGALEWPAPPIPTRFPDYGEPRCADKTCVQLQASCSGGTCCTTYQAACVMNGVLPLEELPFQRGVGLFLRNSERGFRGLDFQARLSWEDRYGACTKPRWVMKDYVDRLADAGAASSAATARDAVAALKDRLIGEPSVDAGAEAAGIAAIVGDLAGPASGVSADQLRRMCGALLGAPQFLLQGIAGRGGPRPLLTPPSADYGAVCTELAASGLGAPGLTVACGAGGLVLSANSLRRPDH